jgi:hypothetical protein
MRSLGSVAAGLERVKRAVTQTRYYRVEMSRNQARIGVQPRRGRVAGDTKHPVIDNRRFPSTEEIAKLLKVPAGRVRRLKELAAETLKAAEIVP